MHKVQPIVQRLFTTGIVHVPVATLLGSVRLVLAKDVRIACERKFSMPVSSTASMLMQNIEMSTKFV